MQTANTFHIRIDGLSTGYGRKTVLHNIHLPEIKAGSVVALVGPNATGKSTLLKAIAGFLPVEGKIIISGDETTQPRRPAFQHVAYMPQQLPDGVTLTVLESVISALKASPLHGRHISEREAEERAFRVLERIGIAGLAMRALDRLSGGQRQLTSLAQTIVREQKLLLLDEPTSALDLYHQSLVLQLIRELADEGRIVFIAMHDLEQAARWANHIVVLHEGSIHAFGKPEDVVQAGMLADVYRVEARVERCSCGFLRVHVDRPILLQQQF